MISEARRYAGLRVKPLHITVHAWRRKLDGLVSINTSPHENRFCVVLHGQKHTICGKCYAFKMESSYSWMKPFLVENHRRLSTPLSDDEITATCQQLLRMHNGYVRLNSLGELSGPENLENYYRICEGVPDARFALYTKRPYLVKKARPKPPNLSVIWSNPALDSPTDKIPPGCNGVFNILSFGFCVEHKVVPSCNLECMKCLRCYGGQPVVVTELLKIDQSHLQRGVIPPVTGRESHKGA